MIDMRILPVRDTFSVRQARPDELLEIGKISGYVHDALALLFLFGSGHVLPEVGHGEDDVSALEGSSETFGVIDVCLVHFDAKFLQGFGFGGRDISG